MLDRGLLLRTTARTGKGREKRVSKAHIGPRRPRSLSLSLGIKIVASCQELQGSPFFERVPNYEFSPLFLSVVSRNNRAEFGFVEAKYCHNNEEDMRGTLMLSEEEIFVNSRSNGGTKTSCNLPVHDGEHSNHFWDISICTNDHAESATLTKKVLLQIITNETKFYDTKGRKYVGIM